jgi:hypothetical protein
MKKSILYGFVIAACLLLALPGTALAIGELQVTGGELGTDYTYKSDILTILKDTPLTISGSTTTDRVFVVDGVDADITLNNVNIALTVLSTCAFEIAEGSAGNVNINLVGVNSLQSGDRCAGLQKKRFWCRRWHTNHQRRRFTDRHRWLRRGGHWRRKLR